MFKSLKPYLALPRAIHVLFFATIVNFIGNFVRPFMTLYLTSKVGLSTDIVGLLVAGNAGLALVGSLVGGKLIDTMGRKKIFLIFRLLVAMAFAVCGFVTNPMIIIPILMLSSLFSGIATPVLNTIITDLVDGDERKTAFSLNYLAINIGFAIGPLLASFLYESNITILFLGDAITIVLSVILVMMFVPETKPSQEAILKQKATQGAQTPVANNKSLLTILSKQPTIILFSVIIVMNFIAFSQFSFGLPLQVENSFGLGSAPIYGTLMTVNALVCFLFTIPITSMTKKNKASLNITLGSIFYAIGFGMLFAINGIYMFVLSTITWSIGEVLISTNTGVYLADHAPITHRGRFNSIFPIIRKTGSMLGPMLAGTFIKVSNIRNLWLFIGGLVAIAALMMFRLYREDMKKDLAVAEIQA